MKYQCKECKDRGFITLLTSVVECECRARAVVKPASNTPHWVASYDSYSEQVSLLARAG